MVANTGKNNCFVRERHALPTGRRRCLHSCPTFEILHKGSLFPEIEGMWKPQRILWRKSEWKDMPHAYACLLWILIESHSLNADQPGKLQTTIFLCRLKILIMYMVAKIITKSSIKLSANNFAIHWITIVCFYRICLFFLQ